MGKQKFCVIYNSVLIMKLTLALLERPSFIQVVGTHVAKQQVTS